jgi:hypothetical protein
MMQRIKFEIGGKKMVPDIQPPYQWIDPDLYCAVYEVLDRFGIFVGSNLKEI